MAGTPTAPLDKLLGCEPLAAPGMGRAQESDEIAKFDQREIGGPYIGE